VTPEQLRAFQRTHANHLGKPLLLDGIQGPQTEWALDFETLPVPRQAIVFIAQTYLGLQEVPRGSNDDPQGIIRRWLERCGAKRGDPWCAAFASHCLAAALHPPLGSIRIAGAQRLGKSLPATTQPWPGDVMWYPTDAVHGHCGIVLGVGPDEVMTIEGNQDHAVRCLRRPRAGLFFASTVDVTSGTCPGVVPSVPLPAGGTR
jgi:hypothetical protein